MKKGSGGNGPITACVQVTFTRENACLPYKKYPVYEFCDSV